MGDQLVVSLCSPTLAGLKTGNLFNVDMDDRQKFIQEVREFNQRLCKKGLRMIPVKYTKDHALIYLYRPSFLKRDFANASFPSCLALADLSKSSFETNLFIDINKIFNLKISL